MRKPAFCICENKDADQLRGDREADQRLCFRYTDSTIPLLPKSEISSFYPSSVTAQPGLCQTWSETLKTGSLTTRLIHSLSLFVSDVPGRGGKLQDLSQLQLKQLVSTVKFLNFATQETLL